jgi:2'-5' RNA ligase
MDRPIIMTLMLDADSFRRLDEWRRQYFPPERNFIAAHVTLFHALPPETVLSFDEELRSFALRTRVCELAFTSTFRLGRGFAIRVDSAALRELRASLAQRFGAGLTPQDRQPFHPHVTVMNKSTPELAEAAWRAFDDAWQPFAGKGTGLALWSYLGGPWALEREFRFAE